MRVSLPLAALAIATPLWADDLPPAPDYFVNAVFETTMAQRLALSCPTLSFEIRQASLYSGEVMARLTAEGFDTSTPGALAMSGFEEGMAARVDPFLARYGLDTDTSPENACAAGHAEMEGATAIARFLMRVPG